MCLRLAKLATTQNVTTLCVCPRYRVCPRYLNMSVFDSGCSHYFLFPPSPTPPHTYLPNEPTKSSLYFIIVFDNAKIFYNELNTYPLCTHTHTQTPCMYKCITYVCVCVCVRVSVHVVVIYNICLISFFFRHRPSIFIKTILF